MPLTPRYQLPYPADDDAPDGPAQFADLAGAVETQVARLDDGIRLIEGSSTANLVLTGTAALIPGTQNNFTTATTNATILVVATWDLLFSSDTGQETANIIGTLYVDGADQARTGLMRCLPNLRATVSQRYIITLASAGSHSIGIRARTTATAGTATASFPNCGWSGTLLDR